MAFLRQKGMQCYGIGPALDSEDGPKGFGAHSDQERILESELYRFVRFTWDAVSTSPARSSACAFIPPSAEGRRRRHLRRDAGRRSCPVDGKPRIARGRRVGGRAMRSPAHLDGLPTCPLVRRLTELWDYARTSLPAIESGKLFYSRNTGLQRQAPVFAAPAGAATPRWCWIECAVSRWLGLARALHAVPGCAARSPTLRQGRRGLGDRSRPRHHGRKDLPDEVHWVRFSDLS
jgi:hypothetical protein